MKPALLICINSLRSGGAERVVSQLLEHLQHDFDIHLALYSHVIEYSIPENIKIVDLDQSENDSQVMMLLKLPYLSYKLSRYCRRHKIMHSVAFLNRPCYINALMRSWWGYKGRVVMCERTHQTTMLNTKSSLTRMITRLLIRVSYNRADLVLANAKAIKDDLRENLHIHSPIEVIYNPVDIPDLQGKMREPLPYHFEEDIFYFIAVGNFRKEKNFPLVVDAFAQLAGMPCKLLLVGDGPDKTILTEKASGYGISKQVVFLGRDNNPFKYMFHAHAFVLCSDVEGFPNVLLEALACGMPVISTDCRSGPREMIAPGTNPDIQVQEGFEETSFGILCPVSDASAMAAAMKKLMSDAGMRERLSSKAAGRAGDFDIRTIKHSFVKAFAG